MKKECESQIQEYKIKLIKEEFKQRSIANDSSTKQTVLEPEKPIITSPGPIFD
jgi:hypothetical protein